MLGSIHMCFKLIIFTQPLLAAQAYIIAKAYMPKYPVAAQFYMPAPSSNKRL
jgi:phage shock protein PspC (stress-responsive transcriptional regulator)